MITKEYNAYLDLHCHYYDLSIDFLKKELQKNNIIGLTACAGDGSYQKQEKLKNANISGLYFANGIYPDEILIKPLPLLLEDLNKINFKESTAIGEIGLDYKITKDKILLDNQKIIFGKQLEIAEKLDKPVIVHTRYATKATLDFLKDYSKLKVVLHWFSGTPDEINEALDRGYYLTQRYAKPKIENITERINQIFIETDYPVFKDGDPTEITGIIDSYDSFCKEYNLEKEEVKKRIINNFYKVFNIEK